MTDRFITPCDLPEGRAREILTILIEECSEVQQRATKALRFGLAETQPGQPLNNSARLGMEIGDLREMVGWALAHGIVSISDIEAGERQKRKQLAKFMQTTE